MLVRTYSSSLSQYRNQTIEVKPSKMRRRDKERHVRTAVIQQGGPPIPIDYAMEKADAAGRSTTS
jgi:phospholipid transport system substrate-binding protein